MEPVELSTGDGFDLEIETGKSREERLGLDGRRDISAVVCPGCGLLRRYVEVESGRDREVY